MPTVNNRFLNLHYINGKTMFYEWELHFYGTLLYNDEFWGGWRKGSHFEYMEDCRKFGQFSLILEVWASGEGSIGINQCHESFKNLM